MNDQDYIRKAVELVPDDWFVKYWQYDLADTGINQYDLDALAAQLVRQVDTTDYGIHLAVNNVIIYQIELDDTRMQGANRLINETHVRGPDRTMNTIKATVDSKVLKPHPRESYSGPMGQSL